MKSSGKREIASNQWVKRIEFFSTFPRFSMLDFSTESIWNVMMKINDRYVWYIKSNGVREQISNKYRMNEKKNQSKKGEMELLITYLLKYNMSLKNKWS